MSINEKQQAIFPDLPRDRQLVDNKGEITPQWELYFSQLTTALQTNFKPEGIVFPQQTSSNIGLLIGQSSVANIIYDSTNNVFKGNLQTSPGTYVWKTFTMS